MSVAPRAKTGRRRWREAPSDPGQMRLPSSRTEARAIPRRPHRGGVARGIATSKASLAAEKYALRRSKTTLARDRETRVEARARGRAPQNPRSISALARKWGKGGGSDSCAPAWTASATGATQHGNANAALQPDTPKSKRRPRANGTQGLFRPDARNHGWAKREARVPRPHPQSRGKINEPSNTLAAISASLLVSSNSQCPPAMPPRRMLQEPCRSWAPVSAVTTDASGKKTDTFGPNPRGLLVFTSDRPLYAHHHARQPARDFAQNNRTRGMRGGTTRPSSRAASAHFGKYK